MSTDTAPTPPPGTLAAGAVVVLDSRRYVLHDVDQQGVATLVSEAVWPEGHELAGDPECLTVCIAAELVHEPALGVWTLPGRMLARESRPLRVQVASNDGSSSTAG